MPSCRNLCVAAVLLAASGRNERPRERAVRLTANIFLKSLGKTWASKIRDFAIANFSSLALANRPFAESAESLACRGVCDSVKVTVLKQCVCKA